MTLPASFASPVRDGLSPSPPSPQFRGRSVCSGDRGLGVVQDAPTMSLTLARSIYSGSYNPPRAITGLCRGREPSNNAYQPLPKRSTIRFYAPVVRIRAFHDGPHRIRAGDASGQRGVRPVPGPTVR